MEIENSGSASGSSFGSSASGSTVETVEVPVDSSALTTSFKDYTVSETLLLLILLSVIVIAVVKLIKEAFYLCLCAALFILPSRVSRLKGIVNDKPWIIFP